VDYLIKPFSYERLRDTVLRFRDKLSLRQGVEKANQEMVDKLMGKRVPKRPTTICPRA
jgi:response regulator of citrate/malate metabolism